MEPEGYFPPSYRASRERLLERAHALSSRFPVRIDSRSLPQRGPEGETLALDFVVFGARRPRHALVLSSGTHGVEGYAGSAIQHCVLDRILPSVKLAPDTAVIVQHANNPYGFAWNRRVNEGNVDLNRNFVERFDPTRCSADYEELFEAFNPPDLDPANEERRWQRIQDFVERNGARRFQQTLAEGQYKYPDGLQFGGQQRSASATHLLALVREHLGEAVVVTWLDFHTGLGASGACELVTGAASDSDSCRAARAVWGETVKSASSGESVSTPLNGLLDRGIEAALPPGCTFAFAYPEYGTWPFERVVRALRTDNWLHVHGDRRDPRGLAITAELVESLNPADPAWRRAVVAHGEQLVRQAIGALAGAAPAG